MDFVATKKALCRVSEAYLLELIGVSRRKFYDWKTAYGRAWKAGFNLPRGHWVQDWEKEAVVDFYTKHEHDGYRRCSYMMMDEDIVYIAPSTVYYILKSYGVMRSRKVPKSKKGTGFKQPHHAHEHWHTDITNVTVGDTVYFLISIIDGYSRSVIEWDLRESMKAQDVGIVFQRAKERFPDATPRCISDNGKQYKCKEFKAFVTNNGYSHVTTSPYYPQSNGKQERFHGTLKSECVRVKCPLTKDDAKEVIGDYIDYYNNERLHSAIGYVTPYDKLNGREQIVWDNRDTKLKERRLERKELKDAS